MPHRASCILSVSGKLRLKINHCGKEIKGIMTLERFNLMDPIIGKGVTEEVSPWRGALEAYHLQINYLPVLSRKPSSLLRSKGILNHIFNNVGICEAHTFLK